MSKVFAELAGSVPRLHHGQLPRPSHDLGDGGLRLPVHIRLNLARAVPGASVTHLRYQIRK